VNGDRGEELHRAIEQGIKEWKPRPTVRVQDMRWKPHSSITIYKKQLGRQYDWADTKSHHASWFARFRARIFGHSKSVHNGGER
jgi:hypothetical protein